MSEMKIQSMTDRAAWEAFLREVQPPTFLQSWAWGETQRALGEAVIRLAVVIDGRTVGLAQAVTVSALRARFLHLPHGPVTAPALTPDQTDQAVTKLLQALRLAAVEQACAFLRVSPIVEDTERNRLLFSDLGFRPAPIHLHAERLWVLDLAPSEEQLLARMRKTTRNLIRRAARDEVQTRFSADPADLERFAALYAETARREHFIPFPKPTLRAEFSAFGVAGQARLALAEQGGAPLAAAFLVSSPESTFYHHGASSRARPKVPGAYALQWAAIRDAKARGDRQYNFWGIAPAEAIGHPWAGLTLFKTGFGGYAVDLVPTRDLPLTLRYWLNAGIETLRRWRRRV